ncbi:MAG TPA: ribosome silencing factor [Elusimicrobiota bacterium]|nr:ribosome silencing factor [Elusimicrobiota bacterium]
MAKSERQFLEMGRLAARTADDHKAVDIVFVDLRRISSVTDYLVLMSAESSPHLSALADYIEEAVDLKYDIHPLHRDGRQSPQWRVVDYGGLVVHVMSPDARSFYGLERLWDKARPLAWSPARPPAAHRAARPRKPRRKTRSR